MAYTHLDEGLDFTPRRQLLLTHTPRHFPRVALNAGNDRVGVWPLLGSIVELLDDDNLFASLSAVEDDGDLRIIGAVNVCALERF